MNTIYKNSTLSFLVIILFFTVDKIFSQQTPSYSEYNYNPFLINAAYAGLTNNTEISLSNSGYMNSFNGSPRSFALSAHGSVNRKKIGLGVGLIRDQIGVASSTSFYGAVSYKIFFDLQNERPHWQNYIPGVLSFGLTFGVQQHQNNLLDLGIVNDQAFAQNITANVPTIGLGVVFNHDTFYAGFSTPNLIGDALSSEKRIDTNNPYYGYFGYRFYNNIFEDYIIKPNVLLKYENGTALQADFNTSISYKNKFELGAGYRTDSSINILAGIYMFKNLRAVYSYNIATNSSPVGNTHGITLNYQLGNGFSND